MASATDKETYVSFHGVFKGFVIILERTVGTSHYKTMASFGETEMIETPSLQVESNRGLAYLNICCQTWSALCHIFFFFNLVQ